jgi:glycerate dehydrogenase
VPEDKRTVAVTFRAGTEMRSLIVSILDDPVDVVFLSDLEGEDRQVALARAEALLCWDLERELGAELAGARAVRFIQFLSAGVDHVPFARIPDRVVVASNVGAYAAPMAEHILAMTLALAKRLAQKHAELARGEFRQRQYNRSMAGSVVGILGFGGIGKTTGRLFGALGAKVHAINTSGATDEPVEFVGTLRDLDQVLAVSDVVVIALPLTKHTGGLIGRRELELMKPDAILVNVARGAIVEERALYEHLRSHPEFSAAIDAWWDEPITHGEFRTNFPFFDLPNILGSPHNSAFVPGIELEGARRASENLRRHLEGRPTTGVVRRQDYEG